jgi:hypothetical protein
VSSEPSSTGGAGFVFAQLTARRRIGESAHVTKAKAQSPHNNSGDTTATKTQGPTKKGAGQGGMSLRCGDEDQPTGKPPPVTGYSPAIKRATQNLRTTQHTAVGGCLQTADRCIKVPVTTGFFP